MSAITDNRFELIDVSPEERNGFDCLLSGHARTVLLSDTGDLTELPKALNELLAAVFEAMRHKQSVFLVQEAETFTTQAAADFLGMSRQFLVRLLDSGEIPFEYVGTHRRVGFKDLVAYRQRRSEKRKEVLNEMTDAVVAAGLDDRYVDLTRSDSA